MKFLMTFFALLLFGQVQAQNLDWWDQLHNYPDAAGPDRLDYISISPGYLGPNALRMPVLGNVIIDNHISFDIRYEYHQGNGDITNNAFLQLNLPIKRDKAMFYVNSIPLESWNVDASTRDERRMMGISGKGKTTGDIAFGIIYKIFTEKKNWPFNFAMRAHAKTTTGGNLANARYTDASMLYWEGSFSRSFFEQENSRFLGKMMLGFYTYQTNVNRLINGATERQNDAPLYGLGLEYHHSKWQIDTDWSNYQGYQKHRDNPSFLRFNLTRQLNGGAISLGYHHGLRQWDWDTFSINYRIHVAEILD
ncbi:hypothetical protein [Roseivirga ehrenbergii]|nr:hypothetical protein [Roseivirga ehrenbergii]